MKRTILTKLLTAPLIRILPLFIVVPSVSLILKRLDIARALDVNLMIVNMLCCCCFLLARAYILNRRFKGEAPPVPLRHDLISFDSSRAFVLQKLQRSGYTLNATGSYAEQGIRSSASVLAMVCLASLLLLGSYDNLFQFGGVVLVGTGDPSLLYDPAAYTMYSHGPLVKIQDINYKLKGVNRIMPNSTYPYGAAELRLTDRQDRLIWQGTLAALGAHLTHKDLIIAMNSLEYNIGLLVLVDNNHIIYGDWLHLTPMVKPEPGFTHEGRIKLDKLNDLDGTALYNDQTERLQLRIRHQKEFVNVELGEAPNHEKQVGKYKVINQGTARQSQVRISRARHTVALLTLAVCTLLAAIAALAGSRRRLWIDESDGNIKLITDSGRCGDAVRSLVRSMEADGDKI